MKSIRYRRTVRSAPALAVIITVLPAPAIASPIPFTEEAVQRGVNFTVGSPQAGIFGYGVAIADLNNNSWQDIIAVGASSGAIRIWQNNGNGTFTDRTLYPDFNPQVPARLYSGVSAADYDNDGDLDLYLSAYGQPDVLLRNNGNWTWTNVTAQAGLGDAGAGCGVSWVDFNNDGWLDIYVANRTGTHFVGSGLAMQDNRLYRNNGDGTFTEVAEQMGVHDPGAASFQGGFFDYNGDGLPDLYLANDKGNSNCTFPSRLFRNDGDTFTEVSDETGALLCIDGMTVTIGDFTGNNLQDLYITNVASGNALLAAQPDGTFTNIASESGTLSTFVGWGAQFIDVNNDSHLEIFICNTGAPNHLYSKSEGFPCNDTALAYNLQGGPTDFTFCVAMGDLTNNGAMDLVVSSFNRPLRVYINNGGANRDWLKVRVISEHAYRDEYNAVVTLTSNLGTFTREIIPNSGFKSQNDMHAHFGLGDGAVIEEVTVRWPSGTTAVYTDVQPNQTLMAISPCLADITRTGTVDLRDLNHLLARYGQQVPRTTNGDLNANGVIDFEDLTALLALFGTSPCGN